MYPLISLAELHRRLDGSDFAPIVLDVRYGGPSDPQGHSVYAQGHIPDARYVDLEEVLSEPSEDGAGGRHPLPSIERFERGMRAAGVRMDKPVVVYDDWNSIAAARCWWLLRHHGKDDVRVLDGGWKAWDGHVANGPGPEIEVGDFTAKPGRLRVVDADGAAMVGQDGILLDARAEERYLGAEEPVDPVAGHIPGARSFPTQELLDEKGRFLSEADLVAAFEAAGVNTPGKAVAYCGSGIQAAHLALAAAAAGIDEDLGIYAGSWSDWITDEERPIA